MVNWQDRTNPQAGGAEIHLHEIFGRIAAWGHQVSLLVSGYPGGASHDEVDGLSVRRVGGRFSFGIRAPLCFRREWAPHHFQVIVEDLNKVPVFMPLFTSTPVVLLVHHLFGTTAFREAPLPMAAATWLLERPIPRVFQGCAAVTVSPSTAQDLSARGLRPPRTTMVPNGVELERFRPRPEGERFPHPTILYLGRLRRYKGVELVLDALAALRAEGARPRFLIAGRGDHEETLRRRTDSLGLGDQVEFLGYVSEEEKLRLFQRSWIHVLTSPKEGWGISILEAAACGTPTVASDSPGLRDSVRDGETGLLVPHGQVGALATAVRQLLDAPARRDAMGREARRFAEGFSWDRSAREMLSVLEDQVAGRHHRH